MQSKIIYLYYNLYYLLIIIYFINLYYNLNYLLIIIYFIKNKIYFT